nr:putative ribonuclease H-like domain-containing protein [Tanacetum cinerariifolium]
MDVKSVFLYGTINEEVYVMQPPGFKDPEYAARVYKVEKAMYGLHQAPRAWYGTLSRYLLTNGFQRGTIDQTLFIKREFEAFIHEKFQMSAIGELNFFLGLQVLQKEDGIFLSQDKYVGDILKKFRYSNVRSSNTPMDKENPWGKDGTGIDVDLHLYRSMISSLMYLTASRPNKMFAVCACAKHQVTPKECHFHEVKRIFRYLKGHPKLRLWYPKDSSFDLVAYSDSDYGGATQDRKSTTGGCQFLGRRLILWQCKKQTIVATSTTEVEYVAAASCCGYVLWIQNQLLDYGYNFMNTNIYIDNNSAICIVKNPVYHSKTKHVEIRHHFIRDCFERKLINVDHIHIDENGADLLTKPFDAGRFQYLVSEHNIDFHPMVDFVEASPLRIETTEEGTQILATMDGVLRTVTESSPRRNLKLQDEEGISSLPDTELFENLTLMGYNISPNQKFTFQKGQFSHQWKFLIHTIMQCFSPKSTGFNEFSRSIATALVCLATNTTYNFSKRIFDGLVKNVNNKVLKFLMYPRATIAKSSTLPYDSAPRVTSPAAEEVSMQQLINELMTLCTSLQRQHSELLAKFQAQEVEINRLKERVKILEDKGGVIRDRSGDDAPIKGMRIDEEEVATERVSSDTEKLRLDEGEVATKRASEDLEEMASVLTTIDAATVLASGPAEVPTSSGSIPTVGPSADEVPTGSDVVPTVSTVFATATVVTPCRRRKGKEVMVESEQIARDEEIARIHAEEELQIMIDGLDRSNEEVHTKGQRAYWKITRLGGSSASYQFFTDLLKHLDSDDLNHLWSLVKETLSKRPTTTEWKLYDKCRVHQLTSKDKDIFMLLEKDLPLRKGLALVMICYKLQVENYSQMADDLV